MVDSQTILNLITKHEGLRLHVYNDTKGIPTIGIGFNLTRSDASTLIANLGLDYQSVLNGSQTLTQDQAESLLQGDVNTCMTQIRTIVPNFDDLADNAQLVLIDLLYNMGLHTLSTFHNTLQAFINQNYSAAASGLRNSAWFNQVGARAVEDIALLNAI